VKDDKRLDGIIGTLFGQQPLAVLSTQGPEFPHASLVAFAASDDLRTLLFATFRQTRKYDNMAREPRVALTVDSRTATEADLLHTIVVTAFGAAHEVPHEERELWQGVYLARHPSLQAFVESPDCALMAVRVQWYDVISDFQNVETLAF